MQSLEPHWKCSHHRNLWKFPCAAWKNLNNSAYRNQIVAALHRPQILLNILWHLCVYEDVAIKFADRIIPISTGFWNVCETLWCMRWSPPAPVSHQNRALTFNRWGNNSNNNNSKKRQLIIEQQIVSVRLRWSFDSLFPVLNFAEQQHQPKRKCVCAVCVCVCVSGHNNARLSLNFSLSSLGQRFWKKTQYLVD